jgi:hypothetical protein
MSENGEDSVEPLWAALIIVGTDHAPSLISEKLSLQSDYSHEVGDAIYSPGGKLLGKRVRNIWSFSTELLPKSADEDEHLALLTATFLPKLDELRCLAQTNEIFLKIRRRSTNGPIGVGMTLSPTTLSNVSKLGFELFIQFFCEDPGHFT